MTSSPPRLPGGLALLAVLASGAAPARADPERLRAVVRVAAPGDRAFLDRLRGQTSDLAVDLVEAAGTAIEPTREGQLDTARAQAQNRRATAVVWLAGADVLVYADLPGATAPRLLARPVTAGRSPEGPASADLEAAALIARAALKAVIDGQPVGDPHPPPVAVVAAAPPPAAPQAPPELGAFLAVGGMVAADGVASDPAAGGIIRAGGRLGRLTAGLEGASTLGKDLPRSTTFVRRSVQALAAYDVARAGRFRLAAELGAGLEWFRLSEPADSGVPASRLEGRRWMGSGAVRGAFAPVAWRHARAELTLGVGTEVVPDPPSIVRRGTTTVLWKLWRFEPRGILGLEVTLR